jgi:hypothetical protein
MFIVMFKCGDEMNIQDFINEISDRLINDESGITFFIGTGFSMWYGYPSWKGLLKSYCKKVYAESERRKLKLSTLHSFKGWEIHTLFLIIDGNVQNFQEEKIYTSVDADWLDFVFANRQGIYNGKQYDIVIGAVADDTIYRVFSLYEAGLLTREETLKRLKIRKLFDQVTFCTEKALEQLRYIGQLDLYKEEA